MIPFEVVVPILLLGGLIAVGVPIAYALLISGTVGMVWTAGFSTSLGLLKVSPRSTVSSFLLSAIPMFILMAEYLRESGLAEKMFTAGQQWLGHISGGLAMATTVGNGMMAALSGSSSAAAASMARISVPEMRRFGYSESLSLGTVSASGTFAAMIPPSIPLIIYGVLTETSVADLFMAGMVPGLLTISGYIGMIYIWGKYDPAAIGGTVDQKPPLETRLRSLGPIWPALVVIVIVLGSLYGGIVTATEAGAFGAVGTLFVGLTVANLDSSRIMRATRRAAEITSMIVIIIMAARVFGFFLTFSQITQNTITFVQGLPLPPTMVMILLLLIYVLLGMFLSQSAILILTLPLTFPLATTLGFHPLWFGIVLTKTVEIGLVTPPLGMNVFIASGAVDADAYDAFKGAARFLIVDVLIVALLFLFPDLATFVVEYFKA